MFTNLFIYIRFKVVFSSLIISSKTCNTQSFLNILLSIAHLNTSLIVPQYGCKFGLGSDDYY